MVMLIVFAQVGWGELFVSHTYRGLQRGLDIIHLCTPQKLNMEPENDGFQKESPLQWGHFQVLCLFWGV